MQQELQRHQQRTEQIEKLLQEVASFSDPHARTTTETLVQVLLDMYGDALTRLLELTEQSDQTGEALIETFVRDDLLNALFLLHGLHPVSLEARITRAIADLQPYLKSQKAAVELLKVEEDIAYLSLQGGCSSCAASSGTLRQTVESMIYKAVPDLGVLHIEEVTGASSPKSAPVRFVPRRKPEVGVQS
jgi:Fe-S cluster biogenesis protein NfuA